MKIGFFAIGPGLAADPDVISLIAKTCEDCGYHSLWAPEHIVLLDQYSSRYPYAQDGRLPFPSMEVDILDPFLALSFAPVLWVIVVLQVLRRAGNYAIMRPAREMLYVVLSREQKYKAKNFIDTAVYRSGDALSAWVYAGFKGIGLQLANIALIAVPLALLWAAVAYFLGKKHEQIAFQRPEQ